MRVAHLPSSYFPESIGGTEVYVRTLVDALRTMNIDSTVVVHGGKVSPNDPPELQRLPPLPRPTRRAMYMKSTGGDPPGFADFIDRWRPDLVHFHAFTLGAGLDHSRLLTKLEIPYLITYHTPAQSCPRGTLMYRGSTPCDGQLTVQRCSECVLQSRELPAWLCALGSRSPFSSAMPNGPWLSYVALPDLLSEASTLWNEFFSGAIQIIACAEFCREVLIQNGITKGKILVLRQALPGCARIRKLRLPVATKSPLTLGIFGRVTHVKGVDLAAEATSILNRRGLAASLEIVGPVDNCYRDWLDRMLRLHPTAKYIGVLLGHDLHSWIASRDLVILPSRCPETGPLALLEAWDQGTPVAGTDLGGIRDFLIPVTQHPLLFTINNAEAIADSIERALAFSFDASVSIPGTDELALSYSRLYDSTTRALGHANHLA